MKKKDFIEKILFSTLLFSLLITIISVIIMSKHNDDNISSFNENCIILDDWTITNSKGNKTKVIFPLTIPYGSDGKYIMESRIPNDIEIISAPALEFYSNYVNFDIYIGNELVYKYPFSNNRYLDGTGNSYHYIRLDNCLGKDIRIEIDCQLKNTITYLIEAPRIGSKTTMLKGIINNSVFPVLISGSMLIISIFLFILYIALRKKLKLNNGTLYISTFTLLFSIYVFLESPIAKTFIANTTIVYTCTFIMLALMPIPLILLFINDILEKHKIIGHIIIVLCLLNFIIQFILHFTNVINFRALLAVTHSLIIIAISIMAILLLIAKKSYSNTSFIKFLTTIPMITGGITDIILIWTNRPSFNNNLWFVIGVTFFILLQFSEVLRSYFILQKIAVESNSLRKIAYNDILSGLENRNAFELEIERIDSHKLINTGCIIIDINSLKHINDTYGHQTGDLAINIVGKSIIELNNGNCYRTGGDEFVILRENTTLVFLEQLTYSIIERVKIAGSVLPEAFTISVGYGLFTESDVNIQGLLKRVDDLMYIDKKKNKY